MEPISFDLGLIV